MVAYWLFYVIGQWYYDRTAVDLFVFVKRATFRYVVILECQHWIGF